MKKIEKFKTKALKFSTKYFGEITISVDERGDGNTDVKYSGREINFYFSEYYRYVDKITACLGIIDRYLEIIETAKKNIIEIVKNGCKEYSKEMSEENLIEEFGEKDLNKIAEDRIDYPDLVFEINNNEISVSVECRFSKDFDLVLTMNESLNQVDIFWEH